MAAVGAQPGSLEFSIDHDTTKHVVGKDYQGESIQVPLVTVDSVLQDHRAIMWKVDVEGFEREVLRGERIRSLIRSFKLFFWRATIRSSQK